MFRYYRSIDTPVCDIVALIEKLLVSILEIEDHCQFNCLDLTKMEVVALKNWLKEKEIRYEEQHGSDRNKEYNYLEFPYSKEQLIEQLNVIEEEVPGDAPVICSLRSSS